MEGLSIQPSTSINTKSDFGLIVPLFSHPRRFCTLRFPPRTKKFVVFASKDEPRLDEWDQMELKFGKMLGEDPKLTLAKILGKKLNPDMSNLEIEKLFQKNKGKMDFDIKEVPFDVPKRRQATNKLDGLNLVRPMPKKGVKFEVDNKPKVSSVKRPTLPVAKPVNSTKDRVPDVALRKPSVFKEDDAEYTKPLTSRSLFNMSSNLGKGKEKDRFSDIALIRKPEPISFDQDMEQESSGSIVEQNSTNSVSESSKLNDLTVEKPERLKPEPISLDQDNKQESSSNIVEQNSMENVSETSKLNDLAIVEKPERLKPEPISLDQDNKQESSSTIVEQNSMKNVSESSKLNDLAIVEKPERLNFDIEKETPEDYNGSSSVKELSGETVRASKMNSSDESLDCEGVSPLSNNEKQNETLTELQPLQQSDLTSDVKSSPAEASEIKSADSSTSPKVVLHKPARLSPPMKGTSNATGGEKTLVNPESSDSAIELEKLFTPPPLKEIEDIDWSRAEDLVKTGAREEVEVISSSTRGFVVSFGSIVGFLPYRNLAAKHKFLAFESWLRKRGLDPSVYKQTLSIIGSHELATKVTTPNSSLDVGPELKVDEQIPSSNKIEDLLKIYDQEKLKFLASFVGQKFKVNVILAERKSRRLILSVKPKEKEELVEKKRKLMAKLSIGDVVKCCIKKITYFGVFVEVEGVPALIHQTEVSWDATLDPASYFKNGQIVEAKVHQIDFSAERIFLSLKDIVPDPVTEAMEVVVGNHESLGGKLAAAEADTEWADVESLVKELQQFEGIQYVSRGRFFLSPGLAPTFQVYMASVLENQYKLLARAENRVQEVIVETSLGKEEMKSAILACTNRVK